jgi:mRNA-degrading endonuclease YafQ of YafQ-DinJ toxin-antitoxin module
MNYKVETISVFDKQAKRLAKKYRSLKDELITLVTSLFKHPTQGTSLGNGFYKV